MEDKKKLLVVGTLIVLGVVAAFFSFSRSGLGGEQPQVVGSMSEMEQNSERAAGGQAPLDPSMP